MHLVIAYLLKNDIEISTIFYDQIALSNVELEDSKVEVYQSQPNHIIHYLLQLACKSCLY